MLLWFRLPEAMSIPGPLLATQQLLHGCVSMVDRYVGATLTADAWNQLLDDEEDAELTVRYVHGRAEPSTRKVIERLLRVNQSDRDKEIQVEDTWSLLRILLFRSSRVLFFTISPDQLMFLPPRM